MIIIIFMEKNYLLPKDIIYIRKKIFFYLFIYGKIGKRYNKEDYFIYI